MVGEGRIPMLLEGYETLQEELRRLKRVDRPAIVRSIEAAREHGDISENAEYHAAKETQGLIEARVAELEATLSRARVIDPKSLSGKTIVFGATVTLVDEDEERVVYQIVGKHEADVKKRRISNSSPLGRALIGKEIGDEIEVETPSGERYFEVIKVEFK